MNPEEQQVQQEIIQTVGGGLLPENSDKLFREKLAAYINTLIEGNFEKLVNLVYRLDVSEQKLKILLSSAHDNAGIVIAEIIIERQLQKIQTRKQFSTPKEDIGEDDKW